MGLVQVGAVLGGAVVLVGLVRVHRAIVEKYLLPELEPRDDSEG